MPDSRLGEVFSRTKGGQDSESHIQLEIERIKRRVRDAEDAQAAAEELLEELENIEIGHPIIPALEGLVRWEADHDYHDGAVPALDAYRDAVNEAVDDGWPNVAVHAAQQAAMIAADLSDDDELEYWIPRIVDLLDQYWEKLTPNTRGNLLDVFPRFEHFTDEETLDEYGAVLESATETVREREDYRVERRILNALLKIRRSRDRDISPQQEALIRSYNDEAEVAADRGQMYRAVVFQRALDNCAEFADEEQLTDWKQDLRAANRAVIRDEMAEIEHEPDEDEIEELKEYIDEIVDQTREIAQNESGGAALIFLLSRKDFLPQLEGLRNTGEEFSLMELVSHRHMTRDGDAIPDLEDRSRPHNYSIFVQFRDNVLASILFRVLEENFITEGDLYLYLWTVKELTVHDIAYLTDFIIAVFDDRYADALHIGIPRLEGAIASILKARGYETASLQDGYTTPVPLPGLLNLLQGNINEDLVEYLRFRYSDISGQCIRNQVAHGRAEYKLAAPQMITILLYDIFRSISWIEHHLEPRSG